MQILCAVNNLKRARANKDYESAWRFYQEWLHLSDKGGTDLWTKVGRAWQQAVLEQADEQTDGGIAVDAEGLLDLGPEVASIEVEGRREGGDVLGPEEE